MLAILAIFVAIAAISPAFGRKTMDLAGYVILAILGYVVLLLTYGLTIA